MGFSIGSLLIALVVQVGIISLVGGVLLRIACWIFNKMSNGQTASNVGGPTHDRSIENVKPKNAGEKNPFAAPASYGPSPMAGEQGVPTPTFLRAVAIVFANMLTMFAVGFCLSILASRFASSASAGIFNFGGVFINVFVLAAIVKYALPTTFGKSAIVTILTLVLGVVASLLVFVPILIFTTFAAPA